MSKKRIVLKVDDKILLRQYAEEDAKAIFSLIDESRKHLSQNDDETSDKYPDIETVRESIVDPPNRKKLRLGIWDKEVFVGSVNLTPLGSGYAELGYWIGKRFLGNHYAAKASTALIRAAFKSGKTKILIGEVAKTNSYSINVLSQLGFEVVGETKKQLICVLGRWIPFYIDAMRFYGVIGSRADLEKLATEIYEGNREYLLKMKQMPQKSDGYLTEFGEGVRYTGKINLGQWLKQNKLLL